jgi:hypothetical protein
MDARSPLSPTWRPAEEHPPSSEQSVAKPHPVEAVTGARSFVGSLALLRVILSPQQKPHIHLAGLQTAREVWPRLPGQ